MIRVEDIQRPPKKGRPQTKTLDQMIGSLPLARRENIEARTTQLISEEYERRKGRPRIEDKANSIEARKPWVALGMSRRTWYSRQAEKRAAAKQL